MLKQIAKNSLEALDLYSLYVIRKSGFLRDYGWFRSFKMKMPIDINDNPLPWITYPAIFFLSSRIKSDMNVFEYGCGGSTLWWSTRVQQVVSVEHNKEWYEKMKPKILSNVTLNLLDELSEDYSNYITRFQNYFDIIVIDGQNRVKCANSAIPALKPDGIIVWDNSDWKKFEEGLNYLHENGFKKIEFYGIGPINAYSWETSIFYRDKNCFGI